MKHIHIEFRDPIRKSPAEQSKQTCIITIDGSKSEHCVLCDYTQNDFAMIALANALNYEPAELLNIEMDDYPEYLLKIENENADLAVQTNITCTCPVDHTKTCPCQEFLEQNYPGICDAKVFRKVECYPYTLKTDIERMCQTVAEWLADNSIDKELENWQKEDFISVVNTRLLRKFRKTVDDPKKAGVFAIDGHTGHNIDIIQIAMRCIEIDIDDMKNNFSIEINYPERNIVAECPGFGVRLIEWRY